MQLQLQLQLLLPPLLLHLESMATMGVRGVIVVIQDEFPVLFERGVFAQVGLGVAPSFRGGARGRSAISLGPAVLANVVFWGERGGVVSVGCFVSVSVVVAIAIGGERRGQQPVVQDDQPLNQHRTLPRRRFR